MTRLTLEQWTSIAQVVLAAMTVTGVLVSLYLSVRALREVQADRLQRQKPHLAFETGGMSLPVQFIKAGAAVPGVNPLYAAIQFAGLSPDAESVRLKDTDSSGKVHLPLYGQLVNYGSGPALETEVTWVAEEVRIGTERFRIDERKLKEARYSEALNSMPAWQQHILPGGRSSLTRLPTLVEKDVERKLQEVRGFLRIRYKDVFAREHTTEQDFYLWTAYNEDPTTVGVTFGDLRGARR